MARISKAAKAARASQAFDLRLAGYSYRQIAEQIGCSYGTVKRDLDDYLDELVNPRAEKLRAVYNARYERMLRKLDPKVEQGDPEAINTAARLLAQLAKLNGSDAPAKTESVVEHVTPEDVELRNLLQNMRAENDKVEQGLS